MSSEKKINRKGLSGREGKNFMNVDDGNKLKGR